MSTATDQENSGAPGELELVRRFVNSFDAETGIEELETPTALGGWLEDHGLPGGNPTRRELERAIAMRESLRELMLANNGETLPADAYERINDALAGAALGVRFDRHGGAELVPVGAGVDAALARIAAIVREAMLAGEWSRLKVCPADDCLWAFYDKSRNRSRSWCRMSECGNRSKVRAFRARNAG